MTSFVLCLCNVNGIIIVNCSQRIIVFVCANSWHLLMHDDECWQPYYCICRVSESGRYRPLAVVNRLMPNRFWHVGQAGWFNIVLPYLSLKYDTVSCMNIHECIYANFERYAGICPHIKNSVSIDSLVLAWTWSVSESGRYRPLAVPGWCQTASGMLSGLVDSILWLIYLLL